MDKFDRQTDRKTIRKITKKLTVLITRQIERGRDKTFKYTKLTFSIHISIHILTSKLILLVIFFLFFLSPFYGFFPPSFPWLCFVLWSLLSFGLFWLDLALTVVSANEITALNINGKDSLWIDRGWRTTDTDKDSGLSETKLLSNTNSQSNYNTSDGGTDYAEVDTRNMSTFYNCRKVKWIKIGTMKNLTEIWNLLCFFP